MKVSAFQSHLMMNVFKWFALFALFPICVPVHAQDLIGEHFWTCPIDLPQEQVFTEGIISIGLKSATEPAMPQKPSRDLRFYGSQGAVWTEQNENAIYCQTGTALFIYGDAIQTPYQNPTLSVDSHIVATDKDCQTDNFYTFTWKASNAGIHALKVVFKPKHHGAPVVARTIMVTVSSEVPVSLGTVPAICDVDVKVALSRASVAGFMAQHSALVVHDLAYPFDPVGFTLADDLTSVTIPSSRMTNGTYEFYTESFSDVGTRLFSTPQIITVKGGVP